MTSYEKGAGRTSDADAPPHSQASDMDDHLDESEALRKAARAGILLLEKNQELQDENEALRAQLVILESERPTLRAALRSRDEAVAGLQDERKQCLVEINGLRSELKAKSAMVTSLLDREQQLKSEVEEVAAAKRLAEFHVESLQFELTQLQLGEGEKRRSGAEAGGATTLGSNNSADAAAAQHSVTNPAASYDSNQTSVFTWADYEELVHKWQAAAAESDALQLELRSVRKEVEGLRKKAAKATEYYVQVEKLEKRNGKLQSANDTLNEELTEERALLESLRTMNLMYKQIADSRPFSFVDADEETATAASSAAQDLETYTLGISVQDVLLDTNMKLETELRELRGTLQLYQQLESDPPNSNSVKQLTGESLPVSNIDTSAAIAELKSILSRTGSNHSEEYAVSTETVSYSDFGGELSTTAFDALVLKVQELQEKLGVAKDMLKHTKLQWSAAVASQKALEECNRSAQAEITRLTQQVDYHVTSMANTATPSRLTRSPRSRSTRGYDSDDEDKWVEETAPYPAPPGDLNSPLIKCLLDHWTTDKAKVMTLTDWLHHAIRGTGKSTPLRLHALTSEVAAGFAQLLVPIMREKHGVSVTIYRRDSVHVLSDMVLQTTQPSSNVPSFTTTASASSVGAATTPLASAPAASTLSSGGSEGSDESPEVQRPWSRFLKGEAQFLYG